MRQNIIENICPYSYLLSLYNNVKSPPNEKDYFNNESNLQQRRYWPDCMVISALHDERVQASDGLKFMALYRDCVRQDIQLKSSFKLNKESILKPVRSTVATRLVIETEGGHEGPPSLQERIDLSATELAFILQDK